MSGGVEVVEAVGGRRERVLLEVRVAVEDRGGQRLELPRKASQTAAAQSVFRKRK